MLTSSRPPSPCFHTAPTPLKETQPGGVTRPHLQYVYEKNKASSLVANTQLEPRGSAARHNRNPPSRRRAQGSCRNGGTCAVARKPLAGASTFARRGPGGGARRAEAAHGGGGYAGTPSARPWTKRGQRATYGYNVGNFPAWPAQRRLMALVEAQAYPATGAAARAL